MHSANVNLLRSLSYNVVKKRMQSSGPLTLVRREGGVEHITLFNPRTRNALSLEMMKRITEDISRAGEDKSVRTIVLRGEGKVRWIIANRFSSDVFAGILSRPQPQRDDRWDKLRESHGDLQHLRANDAARVKGSGSCHWGGHRLSSCSWMSANRLLWPCGCHT